MKKTFDAIASILALSITIFVVCGVGIFYWLFNQYTVQGEFTERKIFKVETGQSLFSIAENLEQQDIITGSWVFTSTLRILGQDTQIKAGEFEIPEHSSMKEVTEILTAGKTVQRFITIPEGLTSHQIVAMINAQQIFDGEITNTPAEGSLLPDTYAYEKGETKAKFLSRLQSHLVQEISILCELPELYPSSIENMMETPCTPNNQESNLSSAIKTVGDILTLASIIEKETGIDNERRIVAGLFINRLEKGMLLQTDPTVIYAMTLGKHEDNGQGPIGRRLLRKDLKIDSPYNTYKYASLPPTPICNPSIQSIKAVFNPESHDYIYMVADGSGGHAFAKTLDQHNKNVAKWRKIRKKQNN